MRGNRLCFAPNFITSAIFDETANLKKEVQQFKEFLRENGWEQYVQVGRFDEERNIFDFKINLMHVRIHNSMKIASYFTKKGLKVDEDHSEVGSFQLLKAIEELDNICFSAEGKIG